MLDIISYGLQVLFRCIFLLELHMNPWFRYSAIIDMTRRKAVMKQHFNFLIRKGMQNMFKNGCCNHNKDVPHKSRISPQTGHEIKLISILPKNNKGAREVKNIMNLTPVGYFRGLRHHS